THQYISPGTYQICLTASNTTCFDTVCHLLRVYENPQAVFFPAAFSPNGDGQNDRLAPIGIGIVSSEMTVYNRWGLVLFETSNAMKEGWDGTYNGMLVESGVYVVHFKATLLN